MRATISVSSCPVECLDDVHFSILNFHLPFFILHPSNMHPTGDAWDDTKQSVSNGVDEFGNTISNLPENAAAAAGSAVGHVENFGDSVENKWDDAVDDVENFPENAAHWTGEKVQGVEDTWDDATQGVEDWGQGMEDAYDQGRDDARDDDDYGYDD
jgi:phage-related protein